tara:strand:- start:108244 stop:109155 length:912 start_codon:yes stop_codon:yes gene_type:complete
LNEHCETYLYGEHIDGPKISKKKLKELLFSDRKVVVHCHRNNEIMALLKYRLLGAKFHLVATRHSATKPSGLTRLLLKKADQVVSLVKSVHQNLGIENVCIPHGVNTDEFKPNGATILSEISQQHIILNTGRIRQSKGQQTLIEACALLKDHPDWALVMVGKVDSDSFLEGLKGQIQEYDISNQVYFIPETTDIVPYYRAAEIFVAPSHSEGFALVTAEAMACECTVIATKDVGVHSEMIEHGKSGYLFEAGNSEELKSVLHEIISGDLPRLEKPARKEIVNHWSARLEAERLAELYLKLSQK